MNKSLFSEKIQEFEGLQNVSYLLTDENLFLVSGYKVLKGQEKNGLLKCVKVTQNGKIKLVYFTNGKKSLQSICGFMNFSAFLSIIEHVLRAIVNVKNNGFLQIANLNLSFQRIYIEPQTLSVGLVYLPLNTGYSDDEDVEITFRNEIIRFMRGLNGFPRKQVDDICMVLGEETVDLANLQKYLTQMILMEADQPVINEEEPEEDETRILAANMKLKPCGYSFTTEFHIHSSCFVIGKTPGEGGGVIPFGAISRRHCQILFDNGHYYIEDIGSKNGTWVNGEKLIPCQKREVFNGDIIRIADVDFSVTI